MLTNQQFIWQTRQWQKKKKSENKIPEHGKAWNINIAATSRFLHTILPLSVGFWCHPRLSVCSCTLHAWHLPVPSFLTAPSMSVTKFRGTARVSRLVPPLSLAVSQFCLRALRLVEEEMKAGGSPVAEHPVCLTPQVLEQSDHPRTLERTSPFIF